MGQSATRQFHAKDVTLSAAPETFPQLISLDTILLFVRLLLSAGAIVLILQLDDPFTGLICKLDPAECTFTAVLVRLMWSSNFTAALAGHAADAIPVLDGEN